MYDIIAECLSARQLILCDVISHLVLLYVSMYVCLYVSRLGMQFMCGEWVAWRAQGLPTAALRNLLLYIFTWLAKLISKV